ncbi:immunoglobulin-like domain-containing protein [Aliarcobacter butzleri]|uniref:immunoglobulin-like domain-containing protein n=1 Tax=Aliarcobacter butzleri TaxID=28197 RepID=UPI003AE727B8
MKEVIGTVAKIKEGLFSVKGLNGNIRTLKVGDEIFKNEIVQGEAINTDLSALDVKLINDQIFFLNGTQEQKFDSSLLDVEKLNEEVAFNEEDITALMETASGEVEEEKEEQDGNSFKAVFYIRDGALTNVESNLRDKLFTSSEKQEDLENKLILEERPVEVKEVPLPTPTKIILTGSEVIEGENITVTATVDNAPQTDLVITLSNNEIITIKAGELTGTVTYNSRADDKYIQGDEIENITIKEINYQDIDTTSTATVTVKDDEDVTNVSITKTQKVSYESENIEAPATTDRTGKAGRYFLSEDTQTGTLKNGITYKISLFGETKKEDFDGTTKGQDYLEIKQDKNGYFVELKITLSGTFDKDISIDQPGLGWVDYRKDYILKAGETETTLKLYLGDVDKINDGSTLISGNSSVGGQLYFTSEAFNTEFNLITVNFDERISYGSKIETTKFNISSELQGDNVVFNIQASSKIKGQGEVTVLVNGKSYFVGLDKDGKGTLTLDTNSVAKDGIINAKIKDFVGFQLEDVSFGSTTLILKDREVTYEIETSNIPDPTKYDFINTFPTAKVEVQKDDKTETYIINLDKNGKGTLNLDTTNLTKEPIIKVVEVDGNFESVDLFNINHQENQTIPTGKTTTIIPAKIMLSNVEVIEGEDIKVTATVDNAPQTDLVITLNNNEIITIKAGELTGTVTFKNPYADDKYVQDDRVLDLSISNTQGGNYKILNTTSTATVTIKDDVDVTKIMLSNVEVIEGEDIKVTATVDNAPQTDLVITLNNNEIITIKAGELTGTVTFKNPYADDKYVQGDRVLDLSISNTQGGNYESLDTTVTAKVTVKDDADVTNVSLSSFTTENNKYATVTAKVDNAPQTDLVITLNNNEIITIKAGELTGTVTFLTEYFTLNKSLDYTISKVVGGNYESLDTSAKTGVIINTISGSSLGSSYNSTKGILGKFTYSFSGKTYGDVKEGDIVTLKVNGEIVATGTIRADKRWYIPVEKKFLIDNLTHKIEATVTTKDSLGNEITATATKTQKIDMNDSLFKITIDSITEDGVIDLKELQQEKITLSGKVDGDVDIKDKITVIVNSYKYETTLNPDKTWSVDVKSQDLAQDSKNRIEVSAGFKDKAGFGFDVSNFKYYSKDFALSLNFEDDNIDLSNLNAIIEDNQLNLKNGVENKLLNISLEDVLKLAPEKSITIHGDEFDKVSFKNTLASDGTQNNWSKTAGAGEEKGYDIYTNTGDELLKVKVEQPISDGITS